MTKTTKPPSRWQWSTTTTSPRSDRPFVCIFNFTQTFSCGQDLSKNVGGGDAILAKYFSGEYLLISWKLWLTEQEQLDGEGTYKWRQICRDSCDYLHFRQRRGSVDADIRRNAAWLGLRKFSQSNCDGPWLVNCFAVNISFITLELALAAL